MRHTNRDITVNNIPSDTEHVATRARDNRRREKQIGVDGIKMHGDNVTLSSIEDDQ